MQEMSDRVESILRKLREIRFLITPQWLAILKILAENKAHLGAEEIYAAVRENFPATTGATVYKTLGVLKSIGQALEIEFSGDYNRYDGKKPYSHSHLTCIRCKKIVDPELASLPT